MKKIFWLCIALVAVFAFVRIPVFAGDSDLLLKPVIFLENEDGSLSDADVLKEGKYTVSMSLEGSEQTECAVLIAAVYDDSDIVDLCIVSREFLPGEEAVLKAQVSVNTVGSNTKIKACTVRDTDSFEPISDIAVLTAHCANEKKILDYYVCKDGKEYHAQINEEEKKLTLYLPKGIGFDCENPTVSVSEGAVLCPSEGGMTDYSKTVELKVVAADESFVIYTLETYQCLEDQNFQDVMTDHTAINLPGWEISASGGAVYGSVDGGNRYVTVEDEKTNARSFARTSFDTTVVTTEFSVKFKLRLEADTVAAIAGTGVQFYDGSTTNLIPLYFYTSGDTLRVGYRKDFNSQTAYPEGTEPFTLSDWHDIELRYSADALSNVDFYLDNAFMGRASCIFTGLTTPPTQFSKIAFITGNASLGKVCVDDVRIYNKCSAEIQASGSLPKYEPEVNATVQLDSSWNENMVTLSGTASDRADTVTCIAVKNSEASQGLRYVDFLKTTENGSYQTKYSIRATERVGTYSVIANCFQALSPACKEFFYITEASVQAAILRINEADSVAALKQTMQEDAIVSKYIGVWTEDYDNLTEPEKEKLNTSLFSIKELITKENIVEKINTLIALICINSSSDAAKLAENVKKYNKIFQFDFEKEEYRIFSPKDWQSVWSMVYAELPYSCENTGEEVCKQIDSCALVALVNRSTWGEIREILLNNEDVFMSETNLNYSTACRIGKEALIFQGMVNKHFQSLAEVKREFDVQSSIAASDYTPHESVSASKGGGGGKLTVLSPKEEMVEKSDLKNDTESLQPFTDMEQYAWALESVLLLREKGIVSGVDENRFEPERKINRAEFVKLLITATGLFKKDAVCTFADVQQTDWYYAYIGSAADCNIVSGKEENRFEPGGFVTRQDMALLVFRTLQASGISCGENTHQLFSDAAQIDAYAKEAVYALSSCGIINGNNDNTFSPTASATRAEAAVIIHRMLNTISAREE